MQTVHATSKRKGWGYVPMIIIRNARGQCVGSIVYRGEPCGELTAKCQAYLVAWRVQDRIGSNVRVK
jgi:hypothetical protein